MARSPAASRKPTPSSGTSPPSQVHAAARLRWLQVPSGGVEDYGFAEIRDRPIVMTNSKIIQGPAMADHAMALLLGLTRRLHLDRPGPGARPVGDHGVQADRASRERPRW